MRPLLTQWNYRLHEQEIRRRLERDRPARLDHSKASQSRLIFRKVSLAVVLVVAFAIAALMALGTSGLVASGHWG
jgi:hypothetical protein